MDAREVLHRIAFGIELTGGNPMRARTYANAARTLKKIPDLPAARASGELAALPGIGKGILAVVDAALAGQPVPALVELEALVPAGVFALGQLDGLGPKKVKQLWEQLDVASIPELEYTCRENRLAALPGFGKTTQDKVLASITQRRAASTHLRLDRADELATLVTARLLARPEVERVAVTGALRRRTETVAAVSLLVLCEGLNAALLGGAAEWRDGVQWAVLDEGGARIELALCPEAELWGAFLVLTTGSEAHVAALRARAEGHGDGDGLSADEGLVLRGRPVPCFEEDEVYEALGLLSTTPERREDGVPLAQIGTARPRLLRREDLRGALHNHTTSSDGLNSLDEMRAAATAVGLSYLGISEHSQTSAFAGGLDVGALIAQKQEIDRLPDGDCTVLSGIESDVLPDGRLDYDDAVLAQLDVVIASVHRRYGLGVAAATARMVAAASHPGTDILGHPLGRLLLGRPPVEFDVEAMLQAAARSGCAVECNGNPQRLDLPVPWLARCKELGVLVSVAADAHSTHGLQHLEYGVAMARRAGLTAEDVLNTRTLPELRAWLNARRAAHGVAAT